MCGIAALVDFGNRADFPFITGMADLVRHRGPDGEGLVFFSGAALEPGTFGGPDTPDDCFSAAHPYLPAHRHEGLPPADTVVALAHRRLSIVDLSPAGHQPMSYANRRYWIVYNGEVYNHVELRAELEGRGHRFISHTDTEVMLAAYAEWGPQCLARFNGMFAFILVDRVDHRLFVGRDRFGVKPLYYWISPSGALAFASEIKQFSALPGWAPRLNGQAAYDFLHWGISDHAHETFFKGVRQLGSGEALDIDLQRLRRGAVDALAPHAWYHLPEAPFAGSYDAAADRFRELLVDAVRLRLRADVPVGSCLSGGLDSSSIVCTLNTLLRDRGASEIQNTFSSCAEDPRFDERQYIDAVVTHTGANAHYVYPSLNELWDLIDAITWHQDEPFGTTSIYAQWHVFRLASRHGVKVMLDGQGADESLGGYHGYFPTLLSSLALDFRWTKLYREVAALRRVHGYPAAWCLKQVANLLLPPWLREPARRLAGKSADHSLVDIERLSAIPRDCFLERDGHRPRTMGRLSRSQLTRTNLQMLLHWEDRDSMAHSVEARIPFLDYRLVEFALSLPDGYKIRDGLTKRVLRDAMAGSLPDKIRMRSDKMGFVTPEESWMREQAPQRFRAALSEAVRCSNGILTERALDWFDAMAAGRRPFDYLAWRLISFGYWLKRFNVAT